MSLLEMTVVILVLMTLVSVLFIGARAWKRASDRALCITNMMTVQKAVRGYANLHNKKPGDTVAGLEAQVVGPDRYFEALPSCPSGGTYTLGGDVVPLVGDVYASCSLATSEGHEPEDPSNW
jgi:type II secretory pathway pseudopilin PulG